ncbi:unnamed protein product, partial [Symbiodinium necroappetens]
MPRLSPPPYPNRPEKEPSKDGSWQLLGWQLAAGVSTLTAGSALAEYPSSCTRLRASFQRRFCAARARAGESPLLHGGLPDQEHTFAFPPQAEMQLATAKWRTLRRVARMWVGLGSGKEFDAVEHMYTFSGPKQQVKSIRAPLRAATVVGPGDSAELTPSRRKPSSMQSTLKVQSETHRYGVMTAVLSVDCIEDGSLMERAWGEEVATMRGFDDVAAERCRALQHVARRLAARG